MKGRTVRVNIHDAVEALVTGGNMEINGGEQTYTDRRTLRRVKEALRAGSWRICLRY